MKYLNKAPKSFVYKMLRKKNIKCNGKKAEGSEILLKGDLIQIYLADDTIDIFKQAIEIIPVKKTFDIVYEDENILICNKPVGLLVQADSAEDKNTLVDQVIYYLYESGQYKPESENGFRPAICNRLDRNTSGIVLAGKNLMALQTINKAIHDNQTDKYYKTIVKGVITKPGELIDYHTKDSDTNQVTITSHYVEGAKKIITRYKPIKNNGEYTLVEIELVTGKTHQIRAHLQSIGHPIIGDSKYGQANVNQLFKQKYGLQNQFLHAYKFVWKDDTSDMSYLYKKTFEADLPERLQRIQEDLF
jgi:23S rRNA pseudouridine955/2504/2580 synthase